MASSSKRAAPASPEDLQTATVLQQQQRQFETATTATLTAVEAAAGAPAAIAAPGQVNAADAARSSLIPPTHPGSAVLETLEGDWNEDDIVAGAKTTAGNTVVQIDMAVDDDEPDL